jgi:RHS repeat-associated protein
MDCKISFFWEKNVLRNITNNLTYPGQYYDNETCFYYNYFRNYDTNIGRYLLLDPIHKNIELSTYVYVSNNPIQKIDPFGLFVFGSDGLPVLTPEIPKEIVEMLLVKTIGGYLSEICVYNYCKSSALPTFSSVGAECFSIISDLKIPPGHPYNSAAFLIECRDECYRITKTQKYKNYCGVCGNQ